jgi:hypothetical protein
MTQPPSLWWRHRNKMPHRMVLILVSITSHALVFFVENKVVYLWWIRIRTSQNRIKMESPNYIYIMWTNFFSLIIFVYLVCKYVLRNSIMLWCDKFVEYHSCGNENGILSICGEKWCLSFSYINDDIENKFSKIKKCWVLFLITWYNSTYCSLLNKYKKFQLIN